MKRDVFTAVVAALLIIVVCFGLGSMRPANSSVKSPLNLPTSSPGAGAGKNVVMHVNGEAVTEAEFDQYLAATPEQYRAMASQPAGRRILADEVVKMKIMAQEGRRLGVEADSKAAAQMAMDKTNIAAAYALQKVAPKPSEAEVRAEYAREKQRFGGVPVSHIVISCEQSQIPPKSGHVIPCTEAMKRAGALLGRLRGGASFAALARSESDDTSSGANGGLLGTLGRGQLPPEIEQVVFALKPGEVSAPLRTQFGVHLFMTGQPVAQPFEEVRPALEQSMRQKKVEETLARMKRAAKVELDSKYFGPEPKGAPLPGLPPGRPSLRN
ncbi:MAG: peptidylprolyl isomerase [Acidobacteriota bacterium]